MQRFLLEGVLSCFVDTGVWESRSRRQRLGQQTAQVSSVQVFRVRTVSRQYDLLHVVKDVNSTIGDMKEDSRKHANGGEKGGK